MVGLRFSSKFLLSIVFFLIILSACKPSVPKWALSQSELEDVLYDYCLAISAADNAVLSNDVDREQLRYQYVQKVFEKHHVKEADFDSTMVWYSADGKKLQAIFANLNKRFDREAKVLGVDLSDTEMYANYSMDGDTANIWNGNKILFLANNEPSNVRTINLPVDDTFLPGDKFKLSFFSNYLPADSRGNAYVLFSVHYPDKSSKSQVCYIAGNYKSEINLTPDAKQDTLKPESINITLYTPPASVVNHKVLLYLTYPSVLRIHTKVEEKPELVEDSTEVVERDSMDVDTLVQERRDTITNGRRLSPLEERDLRETRHEINIVKERVIRPSGRPQQRRRVSR